MIKNWKKFNESVDDNIVETVKDILLDFNDNGFSVDVNMESDIIDSHDIDELSVTISKNGEPLSNRMSSECHITR